MLTSLKATRPTDKARFSGFLICCLWSFGLQVTMEVGEAYAEEIGAIFFETSAKEGTNIHQLFSAVGEQLSPALLDTMYTVLRLHPLVPAGRKLPLERLLAETTSFGTIKPISLHSQDNGRGRCRCQQSY